MALCSQGCPKVGSDCTISHAGLFVYSMVSFCCVVPCGKSFVKSTVFTPGSFWVNGTVLVTYSRLGSTGR